MREDRLRHRVFYREPPLFSRRHAGQQHRVTQLRTPAVTLRHRSTGLQSAPKPLLSLALGPGRVLVDLAMAIAEGAEYPQMEERIRS